MGAGAERQLNGKRANIPSRAKDQYAVTGVNLRVLEEHLERGHGNHRNRRRLLIVQSARLRGEHSNARHGVFSVRADEARIRDTEHLRALREPFDTRTERNHGARQI